MSYLKTQFLPLYIEDLVIYYLLEYLLFALLFIFRSIICKIDFYVCIEIELNFSFSRVDIHLFQHHLLKRLYSPLLYNATCISFLSQ